MEMVVENRARWAGSLFITFTLLQLEQQCICDTSLSDWS